jgi:hypothetical protein
MRYLRRLAVLALAVTAWVMLAAHGVAALHTVNIDFGNGGAYVGSGGVLSSLGGNYWNEVVIGSTGPGQFYFPYDPSYAGLRDEFGALIRPYAGVDVIYTSGAGSPTTSIGTGPLNDGMQLVGPFMGLRIAELSPLVPVELVVYFNNPIGELPTTNAIEVNTHFNPGLGQAASTLLAPTGVFAGFEGRDYLRFTGIQAMQTTLGYPPIPGVIIGVPGGSVANIAAIQIRGDFIPEPSAIVVALVLAGGSAIARRRRRDESVL